MKMHKKVVCFLLAALMCFCFGMIGANAQSAAGDGLEITLTTDKQKYDAAETITAYVAVKNTNDFAVENVKAECILLAGYEAKGQMSVSTAELAAGQELTLTAAQTPTPNVDTGDRGGLPFSGGAAIMALLAVAGCIYALVKKNRGLLAVILCAAMVMSSIPVSYIPLVSAASGERTVTVTETVEVDGEERTLKAVVTYTEIPEVEESGESASATEATESASATEATESASETEATESASETEATESASETEATESASETGATESASETEATESASETGATESASETEATESASETGATESASETEATESASTTEATESTTTTEAVGDDSDEEPDDPENLVADYEFVLNANASADTVKEILYQVRWHKNDKTGGADATVEILSSEGYSSDDGCIHYDIADSGTLTNVIQICLDLENVVKGAHTYSVGFYAKLVEKTATDANVSLTTTACKLRSPDNSYVYSNSESFPINEGTGEWTKYEVLLTANATVELAQLLYQIGGSSLQNVDLYLDDFFVIDVTDPLDVTIEVDDAIEENVVVSLEQSDDTQYDFYAAAKEASGLLLNSWVDGYGNKVSPNSCYTVTDQLSDEKYTAVFGEYTFTEKTLAAKTGEELTVVLNSHSVTTGSAAASAAVTAPDGLTIVDSGVIFYPGYWTENFNVFSNGIVNEAAETMTDGAYSVTAAIETKYGVLARAYAIAKTADGELVIRYSDTEYAKAPDTSAKTDYNSVVYLEALGMAYEGMTRESSQSFVNNIVTSGCDLISFCPMLYKMSAWDSEKDTWWSKYGDDITALKDSYLYSVAKGVVDYTNGGDDMVQDVLDACTDNNVGVFMDYRMNEGHKGDDKTTATHTPFWLEYEEYWIGSNNTLNYLCTEVQDFYFEILEEFMTTYEVDGLTLDFQRHPCYFKDGEEGRGSAVLTEFIGRIKEMINRISVYKGREIQLAVRVPQTVEEAADIGIDVAAWDALGYCDIVFAGPFYTNSHTATDVEGYKEVLSDDTDLIALVHYITEQTTVGTTQLRRYVTKEEIYATAKGLLDRGADGIFWWNMQYHAKPNEIYSLLEFVNDYIDLSPEDRADSDFAKAEKNYVFLSSELYAGLNGHDQKASIYINEQTENYKAAYLRVEANGIFDDTTEIEVYFNGVKLEEITHSITEFFEVYTNSRSYYASADKLKFYQIPLTAFADGTDSLHTVEIKSVSGYETCKYMNTVHIGLFHEEYVEPVDTSWDMSLSENNLALGDMVAVLKSGVTTVETNEGFHFDITSAGAASLQIFRDLGAVTKGQFYKVSFKTKLTEKEATENDATLKVNAMFLCDGTATKLCSESVSFTMTEGDWTEHEYIFEVNASSTVAAGGRLMLQIGDASCEGLDFYIKDFAMVEMEHVPGENLVTSTMTAWWGGNTESGSCKFEEERSVIYFDITETSAINNMVVWTPEVGDFKVGEVYKVSFKAKLTQKTPNDTDATVGGRMTLAHGSSFNNGCSAIIYPAISESSDYVTYEYYLEVTTASEGGKVMLQLGNANTTNLDLYIRDFSVKKIELAEVENAGNRMAGNIVAKISASDGADATVESGFCFEITHSGTYINTVQVYRDIGTLAAGTYKVGFWAKLNEKTPTETDATLLVSRVRLCSQSSTDTLYADNVATSIVEGDGDWAYYEYTMEVTVAAEDARLMIQMGGDSKENLELYMKDFFVVRVDYSQSEDNLIPGSVSATEKGCGKVTVSNSDGIVYYDITNSCTNINEMQVFRNIGTLATGTYKVGFWAKLNEKTPTETDATLLVSRVRLCSWNSTDTMYAGNVETSIVEGDGDWAYYEYTMEVTEAAEDARLMIQMGGDSKENLELYMKNFFVVLIGDSDE